MTQRLTVTFRKEGSARFLSHLDLLATLEFAIRRARLPVALAEGFNPRPRMSLAAPLPLGHIGERELLEVTLKEDLDPEDVRSRLAAWVPDGIVILSVEESPSGAKVAASRLRGVVYRIRLAEPAEDLPVRIADLMAKDSAEVQEEREGTTRTRDVRRHILGLEALGEQELAATLRLGGEGTIRPEQVLELLSIPVSGAQFTRKSINLATVP
jgi:radical SAM-linked protein